MDKENLEILYLKTRVAELQRLCELHTQKLDKKNKNNLHVVRVSSGEIEFSNGLVLSSDHESDCCESHYLSFNDLTLADFEGLEFDLSQKFFDRIPDYGIALLPINVFPVRVPGYAENNGYYSSQLDLVLLENGKIFWREDISDCQAW